MQAAHFNASAGSRLGKLRRRGRSERTAHFLDKAVRTGALLSRELAQTLSIGIRSRIVAAVGARLPDLALHAGCRALFRLPHR
jgi:hypothetical protein